MATTHPDHQGASGAFPGQWEPFGIKGDFFTLVPTVIPAGVDSGEGSGLLWLLVLLNHDPQSYFILVRDPYLESLQSQ